MEAAKTIRFEINLQKGRQICAQAPVNGAYEADGVRVEVKQAARGACQWGEIRVALQNESCRENWNLALSRPVRVWVPFEKPKKMTALYLFNEWWTRPAFLERFPEIPDRTQVLLCEYADRFACVVPMVGEAFKAVLSGGTDTELCLTMAAALGGQRTLSEPLYVVGEGRDIYGAIREAFREIAAYKGIRLREARRVPEMFRYLGWCSWDAFYKDVSEAGIREKAEELSEKHIPVRWMLIDDGWLAEKDELLYDFLPDQKKFPHGFREMTEDIRKTTAVSWFGVWHALGGYWGGIAPESPLAQKEQAHLYRAVNGKLLPSPFTGEGFYRDWYAALNREGISFVKVDGQSAVPYYFENSLPLGAAARGMNEALEGGASRMDGAVINCMGMAMESILARPATAVSRNSDDFCPNKADGFAEHLLQNAYNALYHNELYGCDWDMFWTMHKDAKKHSLLRAVSGGPVYTSDKPGATDPEVLKPLVYHDGELLQMARAAKPTADCVFSNPLKKGVLKLHNVAPYGGQTAGGIAAFNLTGRAQHFSFSPAEIPDLERADAYWVYDYFQQKAAFLAPNATYGAALEADQFAWFLLLPCGAHGAYLGLLDKYAGFLAVESLCEGEGTTVLTLHETGRFGWISEKPPRSLFVNAQEFTGEIEQIAPCVYAAALPESPEKAAVTLLW